MKILSHRGYWKQANEQNTYAAFQRSFSLGFGTETDIRDSNQNLVISHDMTNGSEMSLMNFLDLAALNQTDISLPLALNIKADGLALTISQTLAAYTKLDCFVFDMSVPDMRSYLELNIPVFARVSEVEQNPVWIDRSTGIWLDSFESEWFDTSFIQAFLKRKKRVCIVSSELHRRSHWGLWKSIKPLSYETDLMLCTDYPEHAAEYFLNT